MEIFKQKAYKHIKRIIGFIDTDPGSPTFGCADRNYWHYKIHDWHNSRMQEVSLALVFYYLDKDSILYKNEKLLSLIEATILFWAKNLNNNGSVNEIYPHEQSFCATSFSALMATETMELLKLETELSATKPDLIKTGQWLSKNGNWHIANQIAASAMALYNIGNSYGIKEFLDEANKRVDYLLDQFRELGYFKEYDGFDLGYSSLTVSLLARFVQKSKRAGISEILAKANEKIDSYLDEFGRYDNMVMSRQTAFLYPFGFKAINSPVLDKIKNGLENDVILNPDWMDDRYVIGLVNDYLMTYFI